MKRVFLNTGKKSFKDVIEPIYMETSFIQAYIGVSEVLSVINSVCSIQLLFWMIERMNKFNTISITKADKLLFIKDSKKEYSLSGVTKALALLKKYGIIISTNEIIDGIKTRNGMYYINPYFFWKNPKKNSRVEMIKTLEADKK